MWVPALYALSVDENEAARAFFYSGMIWLLFTGLLAIVTSNYPTTVSPRSNLLALVMSYAVLPLMATVPVLQAVPDTFFGNAWFEMVSSFTTTGATVYDVPGRLPATVHLWRAMMGWFGGLFILVAAAAVLAPLNLGGVELISGRVAGRSGTGARQVTEVADASLRVRRLTAIIVPSYVGLTVVLWVVLVALGNQGDVALVRAMGILSCSGIAMDPGQPAVAGGFWAEAAMALVLVTAVTRKAFPSIGAEFGHTQLPRDPELRLAGLIILVTATVLMLRYWDSRVDSDLATGVLQLLAGFWAGLFTALSFLTTTGYLPQGWADISVWSGLGAPGMLLIGLVVVGGGVATTAGGVKLLRVYALFRQGEEELVRLVHPHAISGGGSTVRRLRQEGAYLAWIFFMLFALTLGVVMMALTLVGVTFVDSIILAVAALGTTGPLAAVSGPNIIAYSNLSGAAQAILAITMVVGRLEMLALLVLFAPDSWRR
ncbi:MAG: potassium transporter TrkG [Paracoccaceae bacterium]